MAVGIVIVSHSATLAEGVVELARQMAGEEVKLEPAGGLDAADHPLGTDAALVLQAIERADTGDGVLVLMDLGSAVMSAEMAVEMLPDEQRARVLLTEAPLVEGAVAAAVTARLGAPLRQVADEARGGLQAKAEHLGTGEAGETALDGPTGESVPRGEAVTTRLVVRNPLGLHARVLRRRGVGDQHDHREGSGQRKEPERGGHAGGSAGQRDRGQRERTAGEGGHPGVA